MMEDVARSSKSLGLNEISMAMIKQLDMTNCRQPRASQPKLNNGVSSWAISLLPSIPKTFRAILLGGGLCIRRSSAAKFNSKNNCISVNDNQTIPIGFF